jgi:MFS transporter, DHA2 family, multidrug resistance protein
MDQSNVAPLSGFRLWAAAVVIAGANFMVVLDMTIANVSIPNIAGSLGATTTQGTWVITSYAVAEAIVLPLTGWLSARFGLVRTFISATGLFVLFSIFCGLATSLSMLVAARVLQGLAGGPLMPLSQTLLLRIFPKEQAGMAITLWSMTTLLAPITGPVLGGWICENWSWPWIFFINIPLGVVVVYFSIKLLARYELPIRKLPIDVVGLVLLIIWVTALQVMLDTGKESDWFASTTITLLAIVSLIGFAAFLIWELNIDHPIVDLKVFRHRAFWVAVLVMSIGYASFMTLNVLTPLWLQLNMDYTASQAGRTIGWTGLFSLCMAPFVARLAVKVDRRKLISGGLIWLSGVTALRCLGSTELTYWDIAFPLMIMGLGMPFFFISVSGMALASVNTDETASAAGLLNFSRTLLAAFAISVMTTNWESYTATVYADLVGSIDAGGDLFKALSQSGVESNKIYSMMDRLLSAQSLMIATNAIMATVALAFLLGAIAIWFAPRPRAWSAETTGSDSGAAAQKSTAP